MRENNEAVETKKTEKAFASSSKNTKNRFIFGVNMSDKWCKQTQQIMGD
jgi:hypothetical protein